MRALPCLLATLLSGPLAAQGRIAWLEGQTPQSLQLLVADESNPGGTIQTLLTQVELLPIEVTNRTAQVELRPDRPRRVVRGSVTAIELPGNGRLLRYRRQAGALYGVLWVDATGSPTVLLELPGSLAQDPFADRLGVAPDGRHAGLVTAAGALWLARLDGQSWSSTGKPVRAVAFSGAVNPFTTTVGQSQAFFVSQDERLWRCPWTDGAVPADVTPPKGPGDKLKDELAPAGDGTSIAFLQGPDKLFSIYLIGSSGPAVKLPPPPAKYEEPGYLPESQGGPRLLLNDDATRLLYTDATSRDEIYVLDTSGALATTHVTSDQNLQPYIGIGIMPAFAGATVVLAVGDIGAFDWFTAGAGTPSVVNLTQTAGGSAPWGAGTLVPGNGYDLRNGLLLAEETQSNGSTSLRLIDFVQQTTGIVARALRGSPALGRGGPLPNVLVPSLAGDALVQGLTPLLVAPAGIQLSPDSQLPAGSLSAFVAAVPGGPAAAVLRASDGTLLALPPDAGLQQVSLTAAPGLVVNGTQLLYFGLAGAATLSSSTGVRVVIS